MFELYEPTQSVSCALKRERNTRRSQQRHKGGPISEQNNIIMKHLFFALLLTLSGCTTSELEATEAPVFVDTTAATIGLIDWSDADSGRLDGVRFRLRDVDAPETGGVGAAIGGAKCEL